MSCEPLDEADLAEKLARLGELEQQFEQAVEREKLAALAEFAAGAGHEINNPLTVITGRAQLLLKEELDPERRRSLGLIYAQAMRVHEMIADLRLFARPSAPQLKPVDVVALAECVVAEAAASAEAQSTAIRRTGDAGPLVIAADGEQLLVALKALVANALEVLAAGGQIALDVRGYADRVCVECRDTGPGLTPEERQHLFDPFYSARQAGRGLGLGLSKCWRIVTLHGGRIDVESQPGQGAVFTITLPLPAEGDCHKV